MGGGKVGRLGGGGGVWGEGGPLTEQVVGGAFPPLGPAGEEEDREEETTQMSIDTTYAT